MSQTGWSEHEKDAVVTQLIRLATSKRIDYATALVAAVATAKEVHECDTAELLSRFMARCRVAPMVNQLMTLPTGRRHVLTDLNGTDVVRLPEDPTEVRGG